MKKFSLFVLLLFSLICGLYFFTVKTFSLKEPVGYCPFCDEAVLEKQTFYEGDLILALCTHRPLFPGHSLIIPKRHVERFELLTEQEIAEMGKVIKKVHEAVSKAFDTSPYLLLQKNGTEVGQSVPHLHVHYIPRKAGDSSTLKFLINMFLSQVKPPLSNAETAEIVEKIKKAMESAPQENVFQSSF